MSATLAMPVSAPYTPLEEWMNTLSHGLAALLSVVGLVVLVMQASALGDPWKIVSVSIYGASLLLLYVASTTYHAVRDPVLKWRLKTCDHCAIFLLIAGTYTPFLLVNLRGDAGWWMFGIIWGLTVFGITMKLVFGHRFKALQITTYLLMGWLVVFASSSLAENLSREAIELLVAGGVVYTTGVVFYLVKSIPYNHAIWHLFVLGGSACHFFAVYFGTLPFGVAA